MLPNPYAFAIYLKLIHVSGNKVGRFDECEDDDIHFSHGPGSLAKDFIVG
jgi:hypothetical protein